MFSTEGNVYVRAGPQQLLVVPQAQQTQVQGVLVGGMMVMMTVTAMGVVTSLLPRTA